MEILIFLFFVFRILKFSIKKREFNASTNIQQEQTNSHKTTLSICIVAAKQLEMMHEMMYVLLLD